MPKLSINTTLNYSPNFNTTKRKAKNIKFIIFHYTGMRKEIDAINLLTDQKSKVSCHYFIKKNGEILTLVPDLYVSWHAGASSWKRFVSINKNSIGIEISNPGHQYHYKKYTRQQITSLKKLLKHLMKKYNIKRKAILGHSDIAPDRKKDPGEKFPWNELAKIKLSWTHSLEVKKLKQFRKIRLSSSLEKISFFNNLRKLGYMRINLIRSKKKTNFLIKAFQRRFLPKNVTGKIDQKTFNISHFLANHVKN